eukprot:GEMP01012087.1.p1 GENE.GEMP01012087.1~~GEMP01012087.1.p1  ORF type:complete len:676 (+),score=135.61 GEMP01012087.1:304-2028(+)
MATRDTALRATGDHPSGVDCQRNPHDKSYARDKHCKNRTPRTQRMPCSNRGANMEVTVRVAVSMDRCKDRRLRGGTDGEEGRKATRSMDPSTTKKKTPKVDSVSAHDLIIIGGGVATGYLCRELIAHNFPGSILVVSNEPVAPYERPALTKAYLHPPHAHTRARLPHFHTCVGTGKPLQDPSWYAQNNITLCLSTQVTNVNVDAMTCTLVNSVNGTVKTVKYRRVVNAAGSSAVTLADVGIAGGELPNVYTVRTEEEAHGLVTALEQLQHQRSKHGRVVVIGGGFIGLEVAAAVRGWGFHTTILHSGAIMARFFPPHVSDWVTNAYTTRGVQFVNGRTVAVEATDSSVAHVRLHDGRVLDADIVVVGIGAKPNVLLPTARQHKHTGCVLVSRKMITSVANCLAIGDAAAPRISGEDYVQLQEVNWARQSAEMAGKTLCGVEYEFDYLPFNYSRTFEYTDAPLVWNFFGQTKGEVVHLKTPKATSTGALWVEGGRVNGALLMDSPSPSEEEIAKIKLLVVENAKVPQQSTVFVVNDLIGNSPNTTSRSVTSHHDDTNSDYHHQVHKGTSSDHHRR